MEIDQTLKCLWIYNYNLLHLLPINKIEKFAKTKARI